MFQAHKPGQARISRLLTLLGGLFLIAWGAQTLFGELSSITLADNSRPLDRAWNQLGDPGATAWRVDLVVVDETNFSPALTIAAAVLIAGGLWWAWFLNRPRIADHLVDMEGELHKVSWPSFSDAWQSTLVVSGFTALVVVLVFTYDMVIKLFVELMPVRRI